MSKIYHLGTSELPQVKSDYEIIHTPVIKIDYITKVFFKEVESFIDDNSVVLILSQNGVKALKNWMDFYKLTNDFFKKIKFWTVGVQTFNCLRNELNIDSYFPELMTGIKAIESICKTNKNKVLIVAGEYLRDDFLFNLGNNNIDYYHLPVYNRCIYQNKDLKMSFNNQSADYLLFTSPSTVSGFMNNMNVSNLLNINSHLISIGPTTSLSIIKNRGKIFYESSSPSLKSLLNELIDIIK